MTTPDEITAAGLILSGVMDIRHRFCRLLAGLEEAEAAADPGTRAVLGALAVECRDDLKKHAEAVRGQVIPARAAARSADPARWSPSALGNIVERAVTGFVTLATCHHRIFQQLDGSQQVREDLRYLLYRALDLSLVSVRHEALVSLKTSGTLQWETPAFRTATGTTAAVAVPWLESLSPLRWPLVVHEVAHYFLPFGHEATARLNEISQAHGWVTDAFEEVLADAIAQRYFGPAYTFALAREGYLYSYRKHVTGGLSMEQRLQALKEPTDLLTALPAQWGLAHREALAGPQAPIDDSVVGAMRAAVDELLAQLAVDDGSQKAHNRPDVVAKAQQLMAQSEPAPAIYGDDCTQRIDEALQSRADDSGADIGHIVDAAVHTPLTDGEIFEAAWRQEVRQGEVGAVDLLARPLDDDTLDKEIAEVTSRDIWLARSLQSAAVHRWLLRAMADI
ncbi:hypothetical protein QWI29_15130 [Mycolicibacterium neoaurum]|uniref:hypothetical protein n=1 Tax=Mycolicibacterium neoaurum TaxID=1795 RepID=UPI0026723B83|nr:hypothetical protein [Mycolicibacterium neoaurum]MDO3401370.1 hypothetical protein [Mycolicibacterium neoaurum]